MKTLHLELTRTELKCLHLVQISRGLMLKMNQKLLPEVRDDTICITSDLFLIQMRHLYHMTPLFCKHYRRNASHVRA